MAKSQELQEYKEDLKFLEAAGKKEFTVVDPQTQGQDWKMYLLMLLLAIGLKSWQPLAIASAKQDDGSYTFNKTSMVVTMEVVKLVFCSVMLFFQLSGQDPIVRHSMTKLSFTTSLHFLVPSLLYGASNTIVYFSMSYINPALFHVLGNIRIIVAGVLYRFIMQRKQSDLQWTSLVLLMVGAALATPGVNNIDFTGEDNSTLLGLFFVVLMCVCSTASSIYTEMFFKRTKELSIFYQNTVLYLYGVVVNVIILLSTDPGLFQRGFFEGWDAAAVQVLICQSAMGVSLSFIFKYLDNIVYVFSLTVSMLLTIWMSILFFDFSLDATFVFAIIVVCAAIYLYYRGKILEKYKLDPNTFEF
jgi:UDP-galactose transporter